MEDQEFRMVAKTFKGLEDVLENELAALGAKNIQRGVRMVAYDGDLRLLYRSNLCLRTALRVLKPIISFEASDPDELYDLVREMPWEDYMTPDSTFAIDSTVNSTRFNHSKYVTYRVKDAIADHFTDLCGRRPSIRLQGADLILNVHIQETAVTISLDSSGEPLSKRGYRVEQTEAPINEALAAGIILKTGWHGQCDFADPMCGSGTFLIEAALIAADINPGIFRPAFAFERWKDFDASLFESLYNDDSEEKPITCRILGGDISPEAVQIARKNIKSARLEQSISLVCCPAEEWHENDNPGGMLVTNPPYGERLRPDDMEALYRNLGETLKHHFQGWTAWVLGYRDEHFSAIGLRPSVKFPILNGALECSLREYRLFSGKYNDFKAEGGSIQDKEFNRDVKVKIRHDADRKRDSHKDRDAKRKEFGKREFNDKETGSKSRDFKRKDSNNRDFKGKDFKGRDSRSRDFKDKNFKGKEFKGKEFKGKEFKGKGGRKENDSLNVGGVVISNQGPRLGADKTGFSAPALMRNRKSWRRPTTSAQSEKKADENND